MDILDRLLGQDSWATRHLLTLCRDLPDEQLDKTFDLGQGSLRQTFVHLVWVMEHWTSLMMGPQWNRDLGYWEPIPSMETITRRFEAISTDFIAFSRQIQTENRLDEMFADDDEPRRKITIGACIVHVATHSMHHRAQVFAILDWLGVDYDGFEGETLAWEKETHFGGRWPLVDQSSEK